MELRALIDGLSIQEKKILLALRELRGKADLVDLERQANLEHVTVMRAALTLGRQGLTRMSEIPRSVVMITDEGRAYAEDGLPERRMLKVLVKRPDTVSAVAEQAGLTPEQAQISLGWLRRKGWAEFVREADRTVLAATSAGKAALERRFADEQLLVKLAQVGSLRVDELPEDQKRAIDELKGRKLITVEEKVIRRLSLTDLGNQVLALGVELVEEVSQLTHELLVSGRWREARFRRYDVTIPGAPIYPGKVHPQQRVIDELRAILLEMGFVEIESRLVESEFYNFDILFQAQDHPSREIHDSLSLSKPRQTELPQLALVKRVAAAHERGVAGSTGWGYKFNVELSKRPVLCSQTTAATMRHLVSHRDPPIKVFCINRVYRHEKIDYKHLAEFYQCEGIVMDRGLTLCDMLGYLRQIVAKLGLPKIRFRPGMFPFTEPSVEADVYHEGRGEWIEILGAGLFRPEVLRPLGIRYPVLAWGLGLTRLIAIKLGLEDIRDPFWNDLQWISSFVHTEGVRKFTKSSLQR